LPKFGGLRSLLVRMINIKTNSRCCNLTGIPGELSYCTHLLELNLATNELKELPQPIGRLTRLVSLNIADNKLVDLPISLGYCVGLSQFGAGINLERNEIKDSEMLRKYKIGPDHMFDFLEKRMIVNGEPKLEEYELPFGEPAPKKSTENTNFKWGAARAESLGLMPPTHSQSSSQIQSQTQQSTSQTQQPTSQQSTSKAPLDDKILVLKKWAHTTIQTDLRLKLTQIQNKVDTPNTDIQQIVGLAQAIQTLKPEVDKARLTIPIFETPKAKIDGGSAKIDQLKAIISAAVDELALTFRGIQKVLETTESQKDIVTMVQSVKGLKAAFEAAHM